MKQLQSLYQKYNNCITNWLFPVLLFFYPLIKVNQGIDVSDTTYSLGNYLFFPDMEGMWVISTYLSNVFGWLLTMLPFGDTLLGMNLYTGILVSLLVLFVYYMLRKWMPDWIVFVGLFIAVGFTWIPTVILYNYLTYILFSIGAILLYKGLVEENNKILVWAGVVLGVNVWTRIANLAEAALIIGLWYYLYIQKEQIAIIIKKTGYCIAGYLIGAGIPFVAVLVKYGFSGIISMVTGLSQAQSTDDSYTLWSMIQSTIDAYVHTGKWISFILVGIVLGMAMFSVKKESFLGIKKAVYLVGIVVLLRFFWGRGMFTFRYYEDYSSMYYWGMVGLYLAFVASGYLLIGRGVSRQEKLWGMINLIIILITPLGSNNYTYQNLNNLFLTAPITIYAFTKLYRRRYVGMEKNMVFPWKAMVASLAFMVVIQSTGFHFSFVFRDGMDGTPRNTKMDVPSATVGMYTTEANAIDIEGVAEYVLASDKIRNTAIYFGNCPGFTYLLKIPSAISNSWCDLDSFSAIQMEEELLALTDEPMIIVRKIEPYSDMFIKKQELLQDYMSARHYEIAYENSGYTVYYPQEK